MKATNVIEINGRLYDARTGKPVGEKTKTQPVLKTTPKQTRPKSVDGIAKHPATSVKVNSTSKKPVSATSSVSHPKTTTREAASPKKVSLKAKRSVTLNRRAVTAPILQSTPLKSVQTNSIENTNIASSALKHLDPERAARLTAVSKSPAIKRFAGHSAQAVNTVTDVSSKQMAPLTNQLVETHQSAKAANSAGTEAKKSSTKEALIKSAVHHATATTSPAKNYHKPSRKFHLKKIAPGLVAFVLVASYITYLNVPGISMKVAAYRAGFAASMPGYKPAGYSLRGPIAHSPGQVSVTFASNTDERSFSLKQQPTTWDSTALLENLVTKKAPNYLTYQDRGLTIYIFDGSSAAWVNGGKLYQVEGNNSRLDTDQLLKIATSV